MTHCQMHWPNEYCGSCNHVEGNDCIPWLKSLLELVKGYREEGRTNYHDCYGIPSIKTMEQLDQEIKHMEQELTILLI